jgi:putative intracellular protease/amidase
VPLPRRAAVDGRRIAGASIFPQVQSRNTGAIYTDEGVAVDGDLVTGRTGGPCNPFARTIVDIRSER